jgi:hypothetical protein
MIYVYGVPMGVRYPLHGVALKVRSYIAHERMMSRWSSLRFRVKIKMGHLEEDNMLALSLPFSWGLWTWNYVPKRCSPIVMYGGAIHRLQHIIATKKDSSI